MATMIEFEDQIKKLIDEYAAQLRDKFWTAYDSELARQYNAELIRRLNYAARIQELEDRIELQRTDIQMLKVESRQNEMLVSELEVEKDEAWRVASEQTKLERDRAEKAEATLDEIRKHCKLLSELEVHAEDEWNQGYEAGTHISGQEVLRILKGEDVV